MVDILHPSPTPYEQAIEQTSAERWEKIDVDLIWRAQDPYRCPARLLPWLAHNRGVSIWYDDWPEHRKRTAIALWPAIQRRFGTIWAIRQCLALVDARLCKYDLPPQRPYLGTSLTGERRERWLAHLPQLRLYEHRNRYPAGPAARFVGSHFVLKPGGAIVSPDPAAAYYGVRAFLWRKGVETPLKVVELVRRSETVLTSKLVRMQLPPRKIGGFKVPGPLSYLRPTGDAAKQYMTVEMTESGVVNKTDVMVNEVRPGMDPVEPRFEEVAEPYKPSLKARFIGRSHPGGQSSRRRMICSSDPAYLHLYQRVFLYDDAATKYAHRPHGTFVTNKARLGMRPFTGDLYIDLRAPARPGGFVVPGPLGVARLRQHERLKRAVAAVRASQGGTDVWRIHTDIFSPLTLGDAPTLDGSVRLGQSIRRF
ncbi:MAG TPA: phage tail protein I [Shinella sp.]|jgi:hypothetical protein|uniref:phage tail protein I n=1 Tax=Shinella sp. TaxID=1870904 RepID=UPI002E1223DD|nr:phage tail protein I [Shinella sp.]